MASISPAGQQVGQGLAGRDRRDVDVRRQVERDLLLPSRLVQAAGPVADRPGGHPVVLLQDAADPDVGRELVLGHPDGAAGQVLGPGDVGPVADVDAAVPEAAGREDRDRDQRAGRATHWAAGQVGQQVGRQRQFGDVELAVAEHAEEDLFRVERDVPQVSAFDRHPPVGQGPGPVVRPAGQREGQRSHASQFGILVLPLGGAGAGGSSAGRVTRDCGQSRARQRLVRAGRRHGPSRAPGPPRPRHGRTPWPPPGRRACPRAAGIGPRPGGAKAAR